MDPIQWIAVISCTLNALGVAIQFSRDKSNISLASCTLNMTMSTAVYGRVFGWW